MKNISYIIFDLDGTLIDSSDGVVEAVNYSLEQMGEHPQPAEKIKPFIGYPLSTMYPHFSDKPIRELYKHFQHKAVDTIVSSTKKLDMVEDNLSKLKKEGYQLAIASTKIKNHITGIIEKFNWKEFFPVYSGGDEVERVKPFPDIFLLTMERMGADSSNTIVVGDTINDILAAKEIGVPVIALQSPYGGDDELQKAEPDYYIREFDRIFDILEELNQD